MRLIGGVAVRDDHRPAHRAQVRQRVHRLGIDTDLERVVHDDRAHRRHRYRFRNVALEALERERQVHRLGQAPHLLIFGPELRRERVAKQLAQVARQIVLEVVVVE